MKTSAITCAALAATLGFSSLAQAQDWNRGHRDGGPSHREARQEHRQDRQQWRSERREARQEARQDARRDAWQQQRWAQAQQRDWAAAQRYDNHYRQPHRVYTQPSGNYYPGYVTAARYQRGGYLPYEYRQPRYYVNDWQAYPGLYAPPYGHQWVNTGSDFVLIALTTGLIASLLTR